MLRRFIPATCVVFSKHGVGFFYENYWNVGSQSLSQEIRLINISCNI